MNRRHRLQPSDTANADRASTPSRRSVLAALGAAPLAVAACSPAASPATGANTSAWRSGEAQPPARVPAELRPGGELDRFVAELAERGEFSGIVTLTHENRPVLSLKHGMANRDRSVANEPDTVFALGSITKVFTGIAIASLAQQGKLAYHEPMGRYLDGFPAEVADTVTVHHLLTHTSGFGDYLRIDGFLERALTWKSVDETWEGSMAAIRASRPSFPAGTGYAYSNSGYHLLGAIVAEVSGQSYYDYVRAHVFDKAGMSTADFYSTPQWRADERIARPYARRPSGEVADVLGEHLFVGSPAGGSLASAIDLDHFAKALVAGELLDRAYTELTLSPKTPRPPLPSRQQPPGEPPQGPPPVSFDTYAVGATLQGGQWILGHNGGAPGVSANLDTYPASGWTVVALSNYGDRATEPIDRKVRELITGTP